MESESTTLPPEVQKAAHAKGNQSGGQELFKEVADKVYPLPQGMLVSQGLLNASNQRLQQHQAFFQTERVRKQVMPFLNW